MDEVHVNGFEVYGRLDTRPYTGWSFNPYTETSFTLADNKIEKGFILDDDDELVSVAGNYVPEVPREFAYITAGVESTAVWNASVSFIYRGAFYTDAFNTPFGGDPEGETGEVPSVWLLAARANYTIPNTNAVIFIRARTSPTRCTSPTARTASNPASAAPSWPAPSINGKGGAKRSLHQQAVECT